MSKCDCGCCHVPDHGACPHFKTEYAFDGATQEAGAVTIPNLNRYTKAKRKGRPKKIDSAVRCVYCDHAEKCHERDRLRPSYNLPLGHGTRPLAARISLARGKKGRRG